MTHKNTDNHSDLTGNEHYTFILAENRRREIIVLIVGFTAVAVLCGMALFSLLKGQTRVAMTDSLAAAMLVTLLLVFKYTPYKRACCYVGVAMMYLLYTYLFFTGAAEGYTYMWHYTFPFFATFLLGAKHGMVATLLLFIPVFSSILYDVLYIKSGYYSSGFTVRFIPSVSVAMVFSYLFEKERERSRKQALLAYQEQERIIDQRSLQLKLEVEDRERIAKKLRHSQKMEALGVMAGGVAHDLNNILAGIVSYPELIRLSLPKESSLHEPLKIVEKSGERAAAVVNDLLTLARNVASVKESTHINILIEDLLKSPEWKKVKEQFPRVSVTTKLQARNQTIICSQIHMRKCIMNLLHNGVEASAPEGEVVIATQDGQISGENLNNDVITLCIDDNGPGIGEEHIDHIFEPFYTTKKMGHTGSGLGLSVVWNTVIEHDGTISVQNKTKGARFTITLPICETSYRPSSNACPPQSMDAIRGNGKILVVDDEPHLRKIATEFLTILGYQVYSCVSGEEALKLHKNSYFDLIVLDMVLGKGLTGKETYERMLHHTPNQKAVIVSGYSTSDEVQKTLALGAHSIIKKPYKLEELGKAVKQCLST